MKAFVSYAREKDREKREGERERETVMTETQWNVIERVIGERDRERERAKGRGIERERGKERRWIEREDFFFNSS